MFPRKLQTSDFRESIALFRDIIIFFAIIAYFLGWVYLNEYLSHFGLYLANLSIPFYYYFIFSYPPLLEALSDPTLWDALRLIVVLLSMSACVLAYKIRLMVGYFAVAVCFLCILFVAFQTAVDKSHRHAGYVLSGGGKTIGFIFDQKTIEPYSKLVGPDLLSANQSGRLRLVWRTEKDVYAVEVGREEAGAPTYRIPVSSFVFSRVFGNTSAREQ